MDERIPTYHRTSLLEVMIFDSQDHEINLDMYLISFMTVLYI